MRPTGPEQRWHTRQDLRARRGHVRLSPDTGTRLANNPGDPADFAGVGNELPVSRIRLAEVGEMRAVQIVPGLGNDLIEAPRYQRFPDLCPTDRTALSAARTRSDPDVPYS